MCVPTLVHMIMIPNIGAHDNHTFTRLFVNSLEGRSRAKLFDFDNKIFPSWFELMYSFKYTFGSMKK